VDAATRRKHDWDARVDATSTVWEIIAAVTSLNADELKSFGRILRKRLLERVAAGSPVIEYGRLRALCESSPWLSVTSDDGGEWSVAIVDVAPIFVDIYSPVDVYSEQLWDSFALYFSNHTCQEAVLPGGRYCCAQVLRSRSLDFLEGLSLGRICHVVQLALTQKKLLGYLCGSIVPYARSQSMVKDLCASAQAPCVAAAAALVSGTDPILAATGTSLSPAFPLASWTQARELLCKLLYDHGDGKPVPLSNMKRLFRSQFQTELSETFLGHSKLCEMLQDEQLSDICEVQLQGNGYLVCPHIPPLFSQLKSTGKHIHGNMKTGNCGEFQPFGVEATLSMSNSCTRQTPGLVSHALRCDEYVGSVRNTFIHIVPNEAGSALRSRSEPRDFGCSKDAWEDTSFRKRHSAHSMHVTDGKVVISTSETSRCQSAPREVQFALHEACETIGASPASMIDDIKPGHDDAIASSSGYLSGACMESLEDWISLA